MSTSNHGAARHPPHLDVTHNGGVAVAGLGEGDGAIK